MKFNILTLSLVLALGTLWAPVEALAKMRVYRNVPYAFGNSASKYHRMDIHVPPGARRKPVVVFVHGGSWRSGDKSEAEKVPHFVRFFEKKGYILVAINHRLLPRVRYAEQGYDVAAALWYTRRYIDQYGGDPGRISLMGYSSGAHLVAMVSTDRKYLRYFGLDPAFLRGVLCLDVNAYDIPRAIQYAPYLRYPSASRLLRQYFSSNYWLQRDASPVYHVRRGLRYPPFLLLFTRWHGRGEGWYLVHDQARRFESVLRSAGVWVKVGGFYEESHGSLMNNFGVPSDRPTQAVSAFLQARLR